MGLNSELLGLLGLLGLGLAVAPLVSGRWWRQALIFKVQDSE